MINDTAPKRYPLDARARWFPGLFGLLVVGVLLVGMFQNSPGGTTLRTDLLTTFIMLLLVIGFFAFTLRFVSIYVELTADAVLLRGIFTRRIPFREIQSVKVPGPGERVEYDQYISATKRWWGTGWRTGAGSNLLLLRVLGENIALDFADPAPVYHDLQQRLDAWRAQAHGGTT